MTTLLIVESPSKCKTIEKYLGSKYKVVGSCGHITSLSDLSQINFETYNINFKKEKPKIIKMLKDEIGKVKEVILATDDDREGESIAWHICNICKLDIVKTKRIRFSEITKNALEKAIINPSSINMNIVNSQKCRQILDLYIGYNISPQLWKYISHNLSAGRCQTPTLKMIYENYIENQNQNYETHYEVTGIFNPYDIKMHLSEKLDDPKKFLNECKGYSFKYLENKEKIQKEKAPDILITSTLQQLSHRILNMTSKETMSHAQTLYENGLITYMRTDSKSYSKEFESQLSDHIKLKYGEEFVNNEVICKEVKAHEGVRVTNLDKLKTEFENERTNKLYDLIYKHTLQTKMTNSETLIVTYYYEAPLNLKFIYNDSKIKFKGWKILNKDKENRLSEEVLKDLKLNIITCEETLKEKKYHYNESQLIKKMENMGIGRPSTYASIIDKLINKNYINRSTIKGKKIDINKYIFNGEEISHTITNTECQEEKNKLKITQTGIEVCEFCYKYYEHLFNYKYTEEMELKLDEISKGNSPFKETCDQFKKDVDREVNIDTIKKEHTSLNCGKYKTKPVILHKGRFGYYTEHNKNKTSLKEWEHYDKISDIFIENKITDDLFTSLCEFIDVIHINEYVTIKKGKYGEYIYYAKGNKKRNLKLEIKERDKDSIIKYLKNKYNIIC